MKRKKTWGMGEKEGCRKRLGDGNQVVILMGFGGEAKGDLSLKRKVGVHSKLCSGSWIPCSRYKKWYGLSRKTQSGEDLSSGAEAGLIGESRNMKWERIRSCEVSHMNKWKRDVLKRVVGCMEERLWGHLIWKRQRGVEGRIGGDANALVSDRVAEWLTTSLTEIMIYRQKGKGWVLTWVWWIWRSWGCTSRDDGLTFQGWTRPWSRLW